MAKKRRSYSRAFKVEAVKLVTEQGLSVAEAARSLGLHENLLRSWKQALAVSPGGRRIASGLPGGKAKEAPAGTPSDSAGLPCWAQRGLALLGAMVPSLVVQSVGSFQSRKPLTPCPLSVGNRSGLVPRDEEMGTQVAVWCRQLTAGQPLPELPLPLDEDRSVVIDLERTYHEAARRVYLD